MRGEIEKSIEEKKLAFVAKVFWGSHVYSTDLIKHVPRTSEPPKKGSRRLDESAYFRTIKP